MEIGASLIADRQAAEAIEPSQRALDHPAVLSQPFTRLELRRAMRGITPRFRQAARQRG